MKFLRQFLDRIHPHFAEGGKLEKLYPLFEGVDSFLYTPADVTDGPSHVRDGMDLKRMMITVIVALIPCIAMAMYNTGYQANSALKRPGYVVTSSVCWAADTIPVPSFRMELSFWSDVDVISCCVEFSVSLRLKIFAPCKKKDWLYYSGRSLPACRNPRTPSVRFNH